jgi:hypothetical protein
MIAQQYRDEMVRLMETVLEEIAPREPCGAAEGRLGEILRRRWGELGHAVLSLALYPIVGLNLSDVMPSRPRRLR